MLFLGEHFYYFPPLGGSTAHSPLPHLDGVKRFRLPIFSHLSLPGFLPRCCLFSGVFMSGFPLSPDPFVHLD